MGPLQKWQLVVLLCHKATKSTKNGLPKWTAQMILVRFFVTKMDLHLNSWYQKILHFKGSGRSQDPKPFWIFWEVFVEVQKKTTFFWEDYRIWDVSFARILFFKNRKRKFRMLSNKSYDFPKSTAWLLNQNKDISLAGWVKWCEVVSFVNLNGWVWFWEYTPGSKNQDQLALIQVRCCKNKSLESWTHHWRLIWDSYDFLWFFLGGWATRSVSSLSAGHCEIPNPGASKSWVNNTSDLYCTCGQWVVPYHLYADQRWMHFLVAVVHKVSLRSWKSARFQHDKGQVGHTMSVTQCWRQYHWGIN